MEEQFDRLEGKIDALIATVDQKFTEVETGLGGLSDRVQAVETGLGGLSGELRAVETRLRGHIEDVDAHFSANLAAAESGLRAIIAEKADAVALKISVLHQDVKTDFKFSMEAGPRDRP